MNLEALKTGGAIRKQLEAVGGSIFHEDWRIGQRAKGITTWIRPISKGQDDGKSWIAANPTRVMDVKGVPSFDLLDVDYDGCPKDWQAANDKTAAFLVDLVARYMIWSEGNVTEAMIEQMAALLHSNWVLTQVSWGKEEPGKWPQMYADGNYRDYSQLPEDQKAKDRSMVKLVLAEARRLLAA